MKIINQYSLIFFFILVALITAVLLFNGGVKPTDFLILVGLLAVVWIGWLFFKPKASPEGISISNHPMIGSGIPVLLEFQSPF